MNPGDFTRTLATWRMLWPRCIDSSDLNYKNYGGRGIKICERWHDFRNFIADMGGRPKGLTLDRINNDGDYEASNCRWANWKEQARNTRNNIWVEINGIRMLQCEAARTIGVADTTIGRRANAGKPLTETRPTGKLNAAQAREIRARAIQPSCDAPLGIEFGISRMAVSAIRRGLHWRDSV